MKLVFLFMLFSLFCSAKSAPYFITPNEGHCTTLNGTELIPCFTIQQVKSKIKSILPSLKNDSLTLLFLSGTHFIYQTLEIDYFTDVDIRPWSDEERVVIKDGEPSSLRML